MAVLEDEQTCLKMELADVQKKYDELVKTVDGANAMIGILRSHTDQHELRIEEVRRWGRLLAKGNSTRYLSFVNSMDACNLLEPFRERTFNGIMIVRG